jgi:5-methylcytosine-specific restriction endonuclease McrBC GTP-binding regulatory subunit McrB
MSINPFEMLQIGNKKVRTAVFYSTNKSRVDYGELYEKFISVCEEVIQIKQENAEKLEELMEIKFNNTFSKMLYESKNLILHGAPGTGKSYLAKEIAANIINGNPIKYNNLSDEQKKQVAFVQFHPNYDYSDFVEGLRPRINEDGTMGFELKDGVFKSFIERAKKNYEDYELTRKNLKRYVFIIDEINRGEISKILGELFYCIDPGYRGRDGEIFTQYANLHSDPNEKFYIPENVYIIGTMNDIDRSVDSFDFAMRRRFRFVELKASEQLDMLNSLKDELRDEAKSRMTALNKEILKIKELNSNYQIGAAYFLKLNNLSFDKCFDELWTDYLEPLLQEYVRGMYNESEIMKQLEKAYNLNNNKTSTEGKTDESSQN